MSDQLSSEDRSELMSRIGQKNTRPELIVRSFLHRQGFRFRVNRRGLPGTPDLWLRKYNAAIFIHGCFWHRHRGCKRSTVPVGNRDAWLSKFKKNVARDRSIQLELEERGIRVLIIWECAIRTASARDKHLSVAFDWIKSSKKYLEIP